MSEVTEQFGTLIARFNLMSVTTRANLRREVTAIGIALVGYIRKNKLSGQVLQHRSGNLKRAVDSQPFDEGGVIGARVGVFAGSRVPYARAQEQGAEVRVPAYNGRPMRFIAKSGDLVFTRRRKAYRFNIPSRSYIRDSLDEMSEAIVLRMSASVAEAQNG